MGLTLVCDRDGRRFPVQPGRPLVLRIRRGDQPAGEVTIALRDGKLCLDNRSGVPCLVNDVERTLAPLHAGDRVRCGQLALRVVEEAAPASGAQPESATAAQAPVAAPQAKDSSSSDRQRHQRRISASRMSAVAEPPQTGLLKRVSTALTGRADRQRLEQLEAERREALLEAGRRSLADGTALGLPPEAMLALAHGQPVTIVPELLTGFARWREDRQRLVRLDAEIAALRQSLGLGPDPGAVILAAPPLRSDEQEKLERAFTTLDAVATQDLAALATPTAAADGTTETAATAVGRRTAPLRRR